MKTKIRSLAPYAFRHGLKIPKGESELDFDALPKDARRYIDGLIKAAVIVVIPPAGDDEPPPLNDAPPPAPMTEDAPPAGDDEPAKKRRR